MKITKLIFCFLISSLVFSKASQIDTSPIQITQPTDKEEILNIYYQNNALIVQGMKTNGRLIVYSIIGNVLLEMNVQDILFLYHLQICYHSSERVDFHHILMLRYLSFSSFS